MQYLIKLFGTVLPAPMVSVAPVASPSALHGHFCPGIVPYFFNPGAPGRALPGNGICNKQGISAFVKTLGQLARAGSGQFSSVCAECARRARSSCCAPSGRFGSSAI